MTRGPALAVVLFLFVAAACEDPRAGSPTPASTPAPSAQATASSTPTGTATALPSSIEGTTTPTATATPSATPTPEVVRPELIDPAARVCIADGSGYFRATMTGALERELDWGNVGMNCGGAGIVGVPGWQQSFGRTEAGGARLDVLFSIGDAGEGVTGAGFPLRVTVAAVIDGESVLFVTPVGGCTIDILEHAPLREDQLGRVYRIVAQGTCTMPAVELDGTRAVEVTDFSFTGVTGWLS